MLCERLRDCGHSIDQSCHVSAGAALPGLTSQLTTVTRGGGSSILTTASVTNNEYKQVIITIDIEEKEASINDKQINVVTK